MPERVLTISMKYSPDRSARSPGSGACRSPGLRVYTRPRRVPAGARRPGDRDPVHQPGLMTDREARKRKARRRGPRLRLVSGRRDDVPDRQAAHHRPERRRRDDRRTQRVTVKGPSGTLEPQTVPANMRIVRRGRHGSWSSGPTTSGSTARCTGSPRSLVTNMVVGVSDGLREAARDRRRRLPRRAQGRRDLELAARLLAPGARVAARRASTFEVPAPTRIIGARHRQAAVGQVAADIRKIRKPEPYKGKGIRYESEYVRKAGKAAKGGAA